MKPEQISGLFFDPYTINFSLCFGIGLAGVSHLQVRNQTGLLRHSGFHIGIHKPEKFQKQENPGGLYGCLFYLFSPVSVSPRMVWFVQIAYGIHSFRIQADLFISPILTGSFKTYFYYICFRMFSQQENSLSLHFRHGCIRKRHRKMLRHSPCGSFSCYPVFLMHFSQLFRVFFQGFEFSPKTVLCSGSDLNL